MISRSVRCDTWVAKRQKKKAEKYSVLSIFSIKTPSTTTSCSAESLSLSVLAIVSLLSVFLPEHPLFSSRELAIVSSVFLSEHPLLSLRELAIVSLCSGVILGPFDELDDGVIESLSVSAAHSWVCVLRSSAAFAAAYAGPLVPILCAVSWPNG